MENKDYVFDENDIFIIISQIIKIILFLHDEKIILYDLTLENILIENIENGKYNDNEPIHVLLCNLEDNKLLGTCKKENLFITFYNKIVYQLGVIICQLLDYGFFLFMKENFNEINENDEIINENIKNNIINMEISEALKEVIIHVVLLKKKNRIELLNPKKYKWFQQGPNKNKSKMESKTSLKININTVESTSDTEEKTNSYYSKKESLYSKKEEQRENWEKKRNIKSKLKEEEIITDEGYLELKKKEKEVLLGIIDPFDKDKFIESIILSKHKESKNEKNCPPEDSDDEEKTNKISNNESEQSTSHIETKKRKRNKSKDKSFRFWKCQ